MFDALEQQAGGEEIGHAQSQAVADLLHAGLLAVLEQQDDAGRQIGEEGVDEELAGVGGVAEGLEDLCHGVAQTGNHQQDDQPHLAAGSNRVAALFVVDEDDGADGDGEADPLHNAGHLPEEDDGDGHADQQTQLHEGGSQDNAVALHIIMKQQEGQQIQDAVDDAHAQGSGEGLGGGQDVTACVDGGERSADDVVCRQHAHIVFDFAGAQAHDHGDHGGSQHGKDQINHDFFLHSDIFCSFYHNNLLVVKERKLWYDEFTIYWEEFPYESC